MKVLQIGCNHCDDHVKDFVLSNQEHIELLILVDINPKINEYANQYYKDVVNFVTKVSAVTPNENQTTITLYHTAKDMFGMHTSFSYEHMIRHHHRPEDIIGVDHPATTINKILDEHQISVLDHLYIDTEGLDVDILDSIDYNKFKIKHITFEHVHTGHQKLIKYLEKMTALGYKSKPSKTDTLNTDLFI